MKTLSTIMILILSASFLSAQESSERTVEAYTFQNTLKISPFELARAEFQLNYERFLNNRQQSIAVMPSIILGSRGDESRTGFQLMGQYRFYLSHLRKETDETLNMYNIGFYAAPYVLGLVLNEVEEIGVYDPVTFEYGMSLMESNIISVEGGALMGIQLDITKRIVIDFYVGGGLRRSEVEQNQEENYSDYGILDLKYTGVKPRVGFSMGITF